MRKLLFVIVAIVMFCSCKTTKPITPTEASHDTIYLYKSWRDSIYIRDSVSQVIELKGDTIYMEKNVYKVVYRDKFVCDTTYISKVDTITNTIVTNELTSVQKAKVKIGEWAIVIIIAMLALLGFKLVNKFKL